MVKLNTVKPHSTYLIVNLDYDQLWEGGVTRVSRPSRNPNVGISVRGLPATARFLVPAGEKDTIRLHRDLQLWMHKLSSDRIPSTPESEKKSSWRSLMSGKGQQARFFTDFAGSETHADYVNGTNLDKEDMKGKPLVTGGAFLEKIGDDRIGGSDCHVVEAIDPTSDFRKFTPATHPHLFFYPSISARVVMRDSKNNVIGILEYISEPFPQYKNKTVMPVFGGEGKSYAFIPKNRTRLFTGKEIPSPFVQSIVRGWETPFYANPYSRG